MPRSQEPLDPTEPDLDVATSIMGNRTKALIIRHLWINGPTTASELVRELQILQGTVSAAMQQLETWAIVSSDIPIDQRHGRLVTYTLDRRRLQELIELWRSFVTAAD